MKVRDKYLMKCNHVATAVSGDRPICPTCYLLTSDAEEINTSPPSLEGRISKCPYCGRKEESSIYLPFFEYLVQDTEDRHYCGCRGWE